MQLVSRVSMFAVALVSMAAVACSSAPEEASEDVATSEEALLAGRGLVSGPILSRLPVLNETILCEGTMSTANGWVVERDTWSCENVVTPSGTLVATDGRVYMDELRARLASFSEDVRVSNGLVGPSAYLDWVRRHIPGATPEMASATRFRMPGVTPPVAEPFCVYRLPALTIVNRDPELVWQLRPYAAAQGESPRVTCAVVVGTGVGRSSTCVDCRGTL